MIVQQHYGDFDSKFLGVSLHFENRENFELFTRLCGETQDIEFVKKMGQNSLSVEFDNALEIYSLSTVLLHELRHFHDFILTPYGNYIFSRKIYQALYGPQSINAITNQYKKIIVPFSRWKDLQLNEIEELNEFYRNPQDDNLYELMKLDSIGNLLYEKCQDTYDKINDLIFNPNTKDLKYELQPYHFFEASAIISQIQGVFYTFGELQANIFMSQIINTEKFTSYNIVIKLLYRLTDSIDLRFISAIVTWCLLGNYYREKWAACPVQRFANLYLYLQRVGLPSDPVSIEELYDEWSIEFGFSKYKQSFDDCTNNMNSLLIKFKEAVETKENYKYLAETIKYFSQMQQHMQKVFLEEPSNYIYPDKYVELDIAEKFVAAPIKTNLHGFALNYREEFDDKFYYIHAAKINDLGEKSVLSFFNKGYSIGKQIITIENAMDLYNRLSLTDFCYSKFRNNEIEYSIAREVLKQQGITVLESI